MDDPTVDEPLFPGAEHNSHHDVLTQFQGINAASQKDMLTWTLQKKVETDPSCCASLVSLLVAELEEKGQRLGEVDKSNRGVSIMSELHMLYYVIIQVRHTCMTQSEKGLILVERMGFMIPRSLNHRVCQCLNQLLTLPLPHSDAALKTLRNISKEMITPGSQYQMRVIAEQNIKNHHFNLQEKVIVLADPAVFSASSEATLRVHLDVSGLPRNKEMVEKKIILHVLQSGLEMFGEMTKLARALEALDDGVVRKYFHDVVLAVNQSIRAGHSADYLNTLREIYQDITTAAEKVVLKTTESEPGSLCTTLMPYPEINFLLWNDEEDLWNLLMEFTLQSCLSSDSGEEEGSKRDSGIERDIKDPTEPVRPSDRGSVIKRRNAYKNSKSAEKLSLVRDKIEGFSRGSVGLSEKRSHMARVVVMGDDRVLGRLARAYCSMREKESRHNMLTKKLNLQLYYIPVSAVEPSPDSLFVASDNMLSLASHLGRVDPWYHGDIGRLGTAISTLSEMPTKEGEPSELRTFLLDSLCYYLRCGSRPVNLPLYSVKMVPSSGVSSAVEDVFVCHLVANISDSRHLRTSQSGRPVSRRQSKEQVAAILSVTYTKTSISKRQCVLGEAPMTSEVEITSMPATSTSADDYLLVNFNGLNPKDNSKIHTKSINIKTLEHWTLTVCLDSDSRRTYHNIQKIQISPCLDPGCNIQSRFSVRGSRELPLSKYLDKVLSLPINTFNGSSV